VYGSDRGKIGQVKQLFPAADGAPAYALVGRGLLDRDTFIPLDAVTRRADGDVFVNVPKLVIGKLPWNEAPTAQSAAAKLGPAADHVEALYRSYGPTGT
jgi:ureidoacrylate peracid hydrolase